MIKFLLIISLLLSFVMTFLGVVVAVHSDPLTGLLISIAGCVCMLRTFYHIDSQAI